MDDNNDSIFWVVSGAEDSFERMTQTPQQAGRMQVRTVVYSTTRTCSVLAKEERNPGAGGNESAYVPYSTFVFYLGSTGVRTTIYIYFSDGRDGRQF